MLHPDFFHKSFGISQAVPERMVVIMLMKSLAFGSTIGSRIRYTVLVLTLGPISIIMQDSISIGISTSTSIRISIGIGIGIVVMAMVVVTDDDDDDDDDGGGDGSRSGWYWYQY